MKKPIVKLGFFVLLLVSFIGCKDITDQYIYKRPPWLEGKLYTQMSKNDDLSLFVQGIARTRYKDVLDRSGYFTVFAPTDDAMQAYLTEKGYASVDDIPVLIMEGIVRYHTLQSGWNLEQLKFYSGSWIDPEEYQDYYLRHKRYTIFEDSAVFTYWGNDQFTNGQRRRNKIIPTGRKVVPLFYKESLESFKLTLADYGMFVNRTIDSEDDLYYGYAKVLESEIPAENGFVYTVDKVMEPLLTVRQHMEQRPNGQSYSKMLALFDEFRFLTPDFTSTNEQEGAVDGKDIDTLYTSSYKIESSNIGFNIDDEIDFTMFTMAMRSQSSVFMPNDVAYNELLNKTYLSKDYPGHHSNLNTVSPLLKVYLLAAFFSTEAAFDTNLSGGILSIDDDTISKQEVPDDVISEKVLCSNGYFVGMNKSYVPRLLSSVVGPVLMRTGYSYSMYAYYLSGLLPALKAKTAEFTLFAVSDNVCDEDSSFIAEMSMPGALLPDFWRFDFNLPGPVYFGRGEIKSIMKNQVVFGTFKKQAAVEFLPTMGGNYVIFYQRNDSLFAQGAERSSRRLDYFDIGDPDDPEDDTTYMRPAYVDISVELMEEPTDNGEAYTASNWFSTGSSNLYSRLSGYSEFFKLLVKSGMANETTTSLNFISSNKVYTGFIPSDQALIDFKADTITNMTVLRWLLNSCFVQGELIFTDGNVEGTSHKTLNYYSGGGAVEMPIDVAPDRIILYPDINDKSIKYDLIRDNEHYSPDLFSGSDDPLRDNLLKRAGLMRLNVMAVVGSDYAVKTQAITHKVDIVLVPEFLKPYFYE